MSNCDNTGHYNEVNLDNRLENSARFTNELLQGTTYNRLVGYSDDLRNSPVSENTHLHPYKVSESITVHLTSYLTGLDLSKQVNLLLIKHFFAKIFFYFPLKVHVTIC